jgi:hypothetical protein
MAAIRGNPRMPPYLLIETFWKAEGKKIEEKTAPIPEMGNTNSSVIPSGVPSSVFWMTERSRGTLRFCRCHRKNRLPEVYCAREGGTAPERQLFFACFAL